MIFVYMLVVLFIMLVVVGIWWEYKYCTPNQKPYYFEDKGRRYRVVNGRIKETEEE